MNKQIIGIVSVGLLIIVGFFVALFVNPEPKQVLSEKVRVVTSFYPLYFFATEIGGDKAEVRNITPAGAEPHDYEPTAQDMVNIENSDLLILNGAGLEAWGENIAVNLSDNTAFVVASADLATQNVVEDGEEILDPHVWLSPILAKQMVDKIVLGFVEADSLNASYYNANANALKLTLDSLDAKYKLGLKSCFQNNIITSHTAFGYLATTYGLKQVSITGLSPEAEPSPKELAEIADFAKDNKVKYIFFESLVSPKLAQTIASEVHAQTLVLNPIEGLTKEEISAGKNYLTEMESNLTNLKIALECQK